MQPSLWTRTHLHIALTDCGKSDLNHRLCMCLPKYLFIASCIHCHITTDLQLLYWLTVMTDMKHISRVDFTKSSFFVRFCSSILILLLCLSCTTRTAQIFICWWQGGRWTPLCHTLNHPSVAASFHSVQGTGHSSTTKKEKQTPKTTNVVYQRQQTLLMTNFRPG